MADITTPTTVAPVELAEGVGVNAPLSEFDAMTDEQHLKKFQNNIVNQSENKDIQSIMNAGNPTPLQTKATPINETLSKLGKAEPAQLVKSWETMTGEAPPPGQVPQNGTTSVLANIKPEEAPAGPNVSTISGASSSMDPGSITGAMMGAYGQQQAANNAIARAVEAKAVADQAQFKKAEQAYAKAELERAETKLKFDADYGQKMKDFEQSVAEYKQAAGEKVMPGKILADMATGQRVQAGIFMALSAYGASISGQENQALKVINNAIERDIEAQKFNIENKLKGARMGIDGSQYLLSQMRQKFGDDTTAILASKDAMLAMTQQQLNINASKLDQATAKPKSDAMNAQIEIQRQTLKQQIYQAQAQAFMLQSVSRGSAKELTPAQMDAMEGVSKGFRDRWVQGYGEASNKEQGQEFIKYASETAPAIRGLKRIQDLTKGFNKITDLTKRAEIQTELAAVLGALRIPITGPGILTESERQDILNKVIGNPNAIMELSSIMRHKLKTTLNKLRIDLADRGKIAGLPADSFETSLDEKFFKD